MKEKSHNKAPTVLWQGRKYVLSVVKTPEQLPNDLGIIRQKSAPADRESWGARVSVYVKFLKSLLLQV